MSRWVNCYNMKESWLRGGENKGSQIPVRNKMQASALTSVTVHKKAPSMGVVFSFWICTFMLHYTANDRKYHHFSVDTQHSSPWQWRVIVQLHCLGELHLDMSLGLQLAPPSLGNWWELCFHSNSLPLWLVLLGFCGGKIVRCWRWCVNDYHDYYWNQYWVSECLVDVVAVLLLSCLLSLFLRERSFH